MSPGYLNQICAAAGHGTMLYSVPMPSRRNKARLARTIGLASMDGSSRRHSPSTARRTQAATGTISETEGEMGIVKGTRKAATIRSPWKREALSNDASFVDDE